MKEAIRGEITDLGCREILTKDTAKLEEDEER